jgi:hypothetical protein
VDRFGRVARREPATPQYEDEESMFGGEGGIGLRPPVELESQLVVEMHAGPQDRSHYLRFGASLSRSHRRAQIWGLRGPLPSAWRRAACAPSREP